MGNFEITIGKFILSALLLVSIFSFIIITQANNNVAQPLIQNEIFNDSFNTLNLRINSSTTSSAEQYTVFNSEEPQPSLFSIVLFSIVSVGKTFSSMIFGLFSAIIKMPLVVLGIPSGVFNLLITWLTITIIIGVWLLYKLGG